MRDLLAECLLVLSYSIKTQIALLTSIAMFAGLHIAGVAIAQGFALNGLPAPAATAIRESLTHVLEMLSWISLVGSMTATARCYMRDRRRLFEI